LAVSSSAKNFHENTFLEIHLVPPCSNGNCRLDYCFGNLGHRHEILLAVRFFDGNSLEKTRLEVLLENLLSIPTSTASVNNKLLLVFHVKKTTKKTPVP